MKRRFSLFLIALVSLSLSLSGCILTSRTEKVTDLMAEVHAAERPAVQNLPDEATRKAINRFSADLYKASAGHQGNVLISPASVYLALAMTLNGADGETKTAMLKVLADQGITVDQINQACRDWMDQLSNTKGKTTLTIANSIWFGQNFTPFKPFLQRNADFYAAEVRQLDFKDKNTPSLINDWVKKSTHGNIDKIVDSIEPDVVMYLINAIYFKSDWQTPFAKIDTRKQTFNTPNGTIETEFMHQIGKMSYFSGSGATGVSLPYEDEHYAFFALLPEEQTTPREWLAKRDRTTMLEDIAGLMVQKTNSTVQLALPKFETSYEDSLRDELSHLGMQIAFDPKYADFSQMTEKQTKDLYISEVKHKSFLRVDEKGTEAAAVTSVEMTKSGMPVTARKLIFDRPFLYGIMDLQTGLPLFLGIMENPKPSQT